MTAHVNGSCIGCGLCANMCAGVFTMTDEGVAAARDEIFPEQEPQVQEPIWRAAFVFYSQSTCSA